RELRAKFMSNVQPLSLSPTGESPTLGRPRKMLSRAEMDELTERDALIGRPEEIIRRLKRLQEGGLDYVMVMDFVGWIGFCFGNIPLCCGIRLPFNRLQLPHAVTTLVQTVLPPRERGTTWSK